MISLQDRTRIAACHPMQAALLPESVTDRIEGVDFVTDSIIAERVSWNPAHVQIFVQPIVNLSDDHASEALHILGVAAKGKHCVVYQEEGRLYLQSFDDSLSCICIHPQVYAVNKQKDFVLSNKVFAMFQYLQTQGYALPCMGFSVKELTDEGVYLLAEEKPVVTKRIVLRSLYDRCHPSQQDLFNKMYKSPEAIEDEKIQWAINQCIRTLNKNTSATWKKT